MDLLYSPQICAWYAGGDLPTYRRLIMEWYHYLIAISGGAIAGSINTLAGNGSAITLTILTEILGLPGNMANGTNRVGIFTQATAGSWAFYKYGKLDLGRGRLNILFTFLGKKNGRGTMYLTHLQGVGRKSD